MFENKKSFSLRYLLKIKSKQNVILFLLARNPQTWVKPYAAETVYGFKATGPNELSIYPGQLIQLAPREVQQTHKLLNTGWALATIDNKTSGLIPINYVRRVESKPFATEENPPVIATEAPILENQFAKDPHPIETNFEEQKNHINFTQSTDSNETITNETEFIDQTLPIDIKDL